MRVSTLSKNGEHPSLFDAEDLGAPLTMAACRNWCGDFYEEATATLFGGRRLRTDGRCEVCPDVVLEREIVGEWKTLDDVVFRRERTTQERFIEVKSCGGNGEALVYEERLKKDRRFVDEGNSLHVAMWRHGFAVGLRGGMTLRELRAALAASTLSLTIVPFDDYERVMLSKPQQDFSGSQPNRTGRGFGSAQYRIGRRCRVKVFSELMARVGTEERAGPLVYGEQIGKLTTYGPREFMRGGGS